MSGRKLLDPTTYIECCVRWLYYIYIYKLKSLLLQFLRSLSVWWPYIQSVCWCYCLACEMRHIHTYKWQSLWGKANRVIGHFFLQYRQHRIINKFYEPTQSIWIWVSYTGHWKLYKNFFFCLNNHAVGVNRIKFQHVNFIYIHIWLLKYVVGSKSFRPDQLFKVTEIKQTLLFFNIVSLYFNTLFNWYINLTIDGTIYPSQPFPFGTAFVWQAGKFGPYYGTTGLSFFSNLYLTTTTGVK